MQKKEKSRCRYVLPSSEELGLVEAWRKNKNLENQTNRTGFVLTDNLSFHIYIVFVPILSRTEQQNNRERQESPRKVFLFWPPGLHFVLSLIDLEVKFNVFRRLKREDENNIWNISSKFASRSHADSIKQIKETICHIHFT